MSKTSKTSGRGKSYDDSTILIHGEIKEIMEKAHALVCQYINERISGRKPTNVKGALKLVKMPES